MNDKLVLALADIRGHNQHTSAEHEPNKMALASSSSNGSRAAVSRSLTAMMASTSIASSSRAVSVRHMSSSATRRQADQAKDDDVPTPSTSSYRYANHARPIEASPSTLTPPSRVNHPSRGVMDYIHHQLRSQFDPKDRLTSLFHRKSPDQIPVGSVLIVESWTSPAKTGMTTFSGVLLAIRRRGTSTSFVLRNLVQKLGVEVRFNLYSPLLKDVKVVARASAGKGSKHVPQGTIKRARRAKLYYLRKDDNRIAGIGRMIKTRRARDDREASKQERQRPQSGAVL
ncbi:unnamed protein product [Jaminaea pallidilutea]